jgi:ABC-type transporter MlaC component
MGREALGSHWSSFTPEQQKEFLGLFRELLQRTYVQELLLFENPNFVYAGEQLTSAGPVVDTKIVSSTLPIACGPRAISGWQRRSQSKT